MSKERIIVSMTSYPGRIANVGKAIFALLKKQSLPPDEIHLWLAIPQFPNKENDLPQDLKALLNTNSVFIHWLADNTKVHKRHEYFKIAKDDDCVFFIDDDVYYDSNLIKTVMEKHKSHPDSIICYNNYNPHIYRKTRIVYRNNTMGPGPHVNKVRWCGQSMIPAKVYPKNILADWVQKRRELCSPISDECWFQPWIVYNNIPIYFLNYDWGKDIDQNNGKNKGLVAFSHVKERNGCERRDNWLNNVLITFPKLLDKYKRLYNYSTTMTHPIIVSMTSWKKRIGNVKPVVESLIKNTVMPTKIICNLAIEEFPNKEKDLPQDLVRLQSTGTFMINWTERNTRVFKKFIPVLQKYNGLNYILFTVDDDELYDETYIETGLRGLQKHKAVVIAKRKPDSTGVWGGMFACYANIFKEDYWNNISEELIEHSMNDPYTDRYLKHYGIKVTNILENHTKKYNDIFPNRGGKVYSADKKQKVLAIVDKIFKENF